MQAIVVGSELICHCTGLQGQIHPDNHKQTQGAAAPGLLLSDSGQVTQVLVSTTISQYRVSDRPRLLAILPMRQVQGSRRAAPKWPIVVAHSHHTVRLIDIDHRVGKARHVLEHMLRQTLKMHDAAPDLRSTPACCLA